jgi:hypothetical protein
MIPPNDEAPPKQRQLRMISFATHATRGLVRDQNTRRKTMFVVVLLAVMMFFVGATFLAPVLNPRERPGWFILYWLACAWLTATAVLLAIFDLLMVRVQGRGVKRALAKRLTRKEEDA